MMKLCYASCALLAALWLSTASVAGDDAKNKAELAKLQGTWNAVEGKMDAVLIFEGNKFTLKKKDGDTAKAYVTGTCKLDASAKLKTIDLTVTSAVEKEAEKFEGKTSKGIYEVDGDTLKWCANEPGKDERPPEFARKVGESRFLYIVFKKEKK